MLAPANATQWYHAIRIGHLSFSSGPTGRADSTMSAPPLGLRLLGDLYLGLRFGSPLRGDLAPPQAITARPGRAVEAIRRFRRARGMLAPANARRWYHAIRIGNLSFSSGPVGLKSQHLKMHARNQQIAP